MSDVTQCGLRGCLTSRRAVSSRFPQAVAGVGLSFLSRRRSVPLGGRAVCICPSVHGHSPALGCCESTAVNAGAHRSVCFPFLWAQSRAGVAGSRGGLLGLAEGLRPGLSSPHCPPPPHERCAQAVLKLLGFLLPPPQLCFGGATFHCTCPPRSASICSVGDLQPALPDRLPLLLHVLVPLCGHLCALSVHFPRPGTPQKALHLP